MWWYLLYYVVPPVSGAVTLAGIIGMLAAVLKWRARMRFERQVHDRLPARRSWVCKRCEEPGERGYGDVCLSCWRECQQHLHEVA